MLIEIDFNSDEALYIQLRNQIIYSIASNQLHEGETLPSVRQLAEEIGINMHTVNKAYTVLKQDGFVKLDRRHGAMVAIDIDKIAAMKDMSDELGVIVAKAICKDISREEAHQILDRIYDLYKI
ncbi:MAG: GntR family transcriptional regulator [Lachnospiraceae bacterium]|nr:GntR family transcriptional regulator [Lachnospiraceae bacterium]